MRSVRRDLLIGLSGLAALLALLTWWAGLGPVGWTAGLAYGLIGHGLLLRALTRSGADRIGPANRVTMARSVLVGGVTALIADSFLHSVPIPLLAGIAAVALALDAVDGRVARRTGTVSAVGGRFDMEVDAFLILVLSVFVAPGLGPWVLGIGLARYVLGLAGRPVPWLRRPVPASRWRKAVAAVQGIVLTTVAAGLVPFGAAETVAAIAAALLAGSFGQQVWWLARTAGAVAPELPLALESARG
jgi:phosphatidylglycerophosphate synthase